MQKSIGIVTILLSLLLAPVWSKDTSSLEGRWEGYIHVMGTQLGIAVEFTLPEKQQLKATIDIPQQGARGLALENVSFQDGRIHFELPSPIGRAFFSGNLVDGRLQGDFKQAQLQGKFELHRGRYQDPKRANLPYEEEEVKITINPTVTLAGTLSLPEGKGPHPAVVMITGSGPQNRDEDIYGFKIFEKIADRLTREGIAVLRTDDRGVGESTGSLSESTTEDTALDAIALVKYLQGREEIDPQQIGLWGHSEGAIAGVIATARFPDIAFLVLMAGTGMSGEKVMKQQADYLWRKAGDSEKRLKQKKELQALSFKTAMENENWDKLEQEIREQLKKEMQGVPAARRQQYIEQIVQQQVASLKTPWFRFFLTYDPKTDLKKITCPVLVIFGELDTQVFVAGNKEGIKTALEEAGNADYAIKIFPQANHLFQQAQTGLPNEYPLLPKKFVPGFLDWTSEWLLKKVELPSQK